MKFRQFVEWFITSSADPRKFSLFIRGFLVVAGGWVLHVSTASCGLGFYCLGIDQTSINQVIEYLTNIVYALALLFGSVMSAWGLLRKLANGRWSAL